jgi:hypothetical protein
MRRKPKRSVSTLGCAPHKGGADDHKRCRTAEAECSTDMGASYSTWEHQQAMWMHQQALYCQDSWYADQQDCSYTAWAGEQALQQQHLAAHAAMAAQGADLMRTTTGVSAVSGIAAALPAQQPMLGMAVTAANTQAVAGTASVMFDDLQAACVQQEVVALQQQCQQLQSRLQMQMSSMQAATPAASAPAAAAGAGVPSAERSVSTSLAPAAMQVTGPVQDAPGAGPAEVPGLPAALQRDASMGTPGSPNSAATAITTASHMQLVEMVVAQLEDPCVSAEADELEAFLDRELRMAATAPRPCAKQIWASQLNDVINDLTSVITCSAVTSAGPARSSSFAMRASAAGPGSMSAGGVLGMQPGAECGSQQMLSAVGPTLADDVFDERLRSLQQQLVQLQSMVKDLRTQVFA